MSWIKRFAWFSVWISIVGGVAAEVVRGAEIDPQSLNGKTASG